jgi:protein-S-isoprenylcysteine O-methyltransferase
LPAALMRYNIHLAIVACWFIVALIWIIAAFGNKAATSRQPTTSRAVQVILEVIAFFLLFDSETAVGPLGWFFLPHSVLVSAIGLALTVIGLAFAVWARFYLGRNWSASATVKQDHELVRSGPYALVRHPIYTGICLAFLGTALHVGQVRALVGLLFSATGYKLKSLTEESMMERQFADYKQYKREVKGLIPFVW